MPEARRYHVVGRATVNTAVKCSRPDRNYLAGLRGASDRWPATHVAPAIDDGAEQFSGLLGIVPSRMGFATVELDIGRSAGLGQYGLTIGKAAKGGGIEAGEGMKGVALDVGALDSRIEEAEVEEGIMANQYRPFATSGFHGLAHMLEDFRQGMAFAYGHTQRMVQLDAGEFQRRRLDISALEGLDPEKMRLVRIHLPIVIHQDWRSGNFQQGVGR